MSTITIPEEFKKLFEDNWRECAIYGGRYSLKSHSVARFLLIRSCEKKYKIACFREYQNSIADSSYSLLVDLITLFNLNNVFEITEKKIINKITGSDFIFKGLWGNEQNIKSIEGIDIAWVEEAQMISQHSLEVLTPTVRQKGSKIIYTYNRLMEEDPVHKRLVIDGRPNTIIININYNDIEKYGLIPQTILDEIEDDKKNRPSLYKHKWLGEPQSLERKIYKNWKIIEEIPHEARLERYGLDFGFSVDLCSLVAIYYYNGGYIIDEIIYLKGLGNKQITDIIKSQDYSALVIADSASPKDIEEIKQYGINIIGTKKYKDAKKSAIKKIQELKISLTKRSINTYKEYNNYFLKMDKNGEIIDETEEYNDHAMDAIRYAFADLLIKDNYKVPQVVGYTVGLGGASIPIYR